jgi:hypothetical protein
MSRGGVSGEWMWMTGRIGCEVFLDVVQRAMNAAQRARSAQRMLGIVDLATAIESTLF